MNENIVTQTAIITMHVVVDNVRKLLFCHLKLEHKTSCMRVSPRKYANAGA